MARIDALGHVNWQLVRLDFKSDADVAAGMEVVANGKAVGNVTSASWSPVEEAPVALARVRREVQVGSEVSVSDAPAVVA